MQSRNWRPLWTSRQNLVMLMQATSCVKHDNCSYSWTSLQNTSSTSACAPFLVLIATLSKAGTTMSKSSSFYSKQTLRTASSICSRQWSNSLWTNTRTSKSSPRLSARSSMTIASLRISSSSGGTAARSSLTGTPSYRTWALERLCEALSRNSWTGSRALSTTKRPMVKSSQPRRKRPSRQRKSRLTQNASRESSLKLRRRPRLKWSPLLKLLSKQRKLLLQSRSKKRLLLIKPSLSRLLQPPMSPRLLLKTTSTLTTSEGESLPNFLFHSFKLYCKRLKQAIHLSYSLK